MYKHILIPTDGSPLSEVAIQQGIALAKSIEAKVTGVTVFPPFHAIAVVPMMVTDTPDEYRKVVETLGDQYLRVIADAAKANGVRCVTIQVEHDHPYQAIIETADKEGCDLIFMASHGRKGVAGLLLGSETTKVLTHSRIPVLVCR